MSLNTSWCHLLVSGFKDELMCGTVGSSLLWEDLSAKLLGIIIDSSLTFDKPTKRI